MNVHLSMTVLYSSLTNSPMPLAYSSLMNLLSSLTHPLLSLMTLLSLMVPYSSLMNILVSTPVQMTACCLIHPLTNPRPYVQPMSNVATTRLSLTTNVSILSSEGESGSMAKEKSDFAFPSQHQSSVKSSTKSERTTMVSTSKQRYVLRLPDSFDLENLRGIPQ